MDSKRQLELFRVWVKEGLRKKGLSFDKNLDMRNIGREVKEINKRNKLSSPITAQEFCDLYKEIMGELITEHFAKISASPTRVGFTEGTSDHEE